MPEIGLNKKHISKGLSHLQLLRDKSWQHESHSFPEATTLVDVHRT